MKKTPDISREKKSLSVKAVIVAFLMVTINVLTLVLSPLLGLGEFNVGYFMLMFVALQVGYVLTLYVRATNAPPIPKKLTKQISNVLMGVADIVHTFLNDPVKQQQAPLLIEYRDRLTKLIMWELREIQSTEQFDQDIILEAKSYIMKKLNGDISE